MLVAVKGILNPRVAKSKFDLACNDIIGSANIIPPLISWQVISKVFPLLKIEISFDCSPRIRLILDCTNYDYEGPTIHYENLNRMRIPWTIVHGLAVTYPGKKMNQSVIIDDVILYPDGEGLVCRVGNEAYHQLHPDVNWQEIRTQDQGKLEFIIDSSVRLLDPGKLKQFGENS